MSAKHLTPDQDHNQLRGDDQVTVTEETIATVDLPTQRDQFTSLTNQIGSLQAERAGVASQLIADGIEADRAIRAGLRADVTKARAVVNGLTAALARAEESKVALDARVDAGDGSVDPLEMVGADVTVRSTKGKLTPAQADLLRAERALAPFHADDHLALLATQAIRELVQVPVLVRKRASDVQDISDAVVLGQVEPTSGYGTPRASGRVVVTEIGTTGLDMERAREAIEATGAEVSTYGNVIEYADARWPLPPLSSPSERAVAKFAESLARQFAAMITESPTRGRTYSHYTPCWETLDHSLTDNGDGRATGKVVVGFGIEGEHPPLDQMEDFIRSSMARLSTGVVTSAGLLDRADLAEVVNLGPWVAEDEQMVSGRSYTWKYGLTVDLSFVYEPVAPPAVED